MPARLPPQAMRRRGFAPNDAEFQELTAAAAEAALSREDGDLQAQVASLCNVSSARQVDLHLTSAPHFCIAPPHRTSPCCTSAPHLRTTPHCTSAPQVDLHGMSATEARAAVLCVLALMQRRYRDAGDVPHDVAVITGRGGHSEGGEPVLRRVIIRLLEDELHLRPLRLEEGVAASSSRDGAAAGEAGGGGNPGRVVLPQETLLRHFRARSLTRLLQPCMPAPPPGSGTADTAAGSGGPN